MTVMLGTPLSLYGLALTGSAQTQRYTFQVKVGYRTGAICRDGWRSKATGRGACSHHGGVAYWLNTQTRHREVRSTWLAQNESTFWKLGHASIGLLLATAVLAGLAEGRNLRSSTPGKTPPAAPTRPELRATSSEPTPPLAHQYQPRGKPKPGVCGRCGAPMVIRRRRSDGRMFLGCTRFPECRETKPLQQGTPP